MSFPAFLELFAQAPPPAPGLTPEDVALACGTDPAEAPNLVCSAVYGLIGPGAWQATLAKVAGGAVSVLVILAVAFIAVRIARRTIKRFVRAMQRTAIERLGVLQQKGPLADTNPMNLQRATLRTETIGGVLRSVVGAGIWAIAFTMVLGVFGVELAPLIAGAGIVGVALGFGSQNLVRDFLSGVFMLLEDQYGVGDIIDVGEADGVVEGISLRTTRLRDVYGTVWYVPNGEIRRVGNKSQLWARTLIDVPVSYETDLKHALDVIGRVADEFWQDEEWSGKVIEEPEVWGVETFGPNEVIVRLVLKTQPGEQFAVNREIRARLLSAFASEDIEIPAQRLTFVEDEGVGGSGLPSARGLTSAGPRPVRDKAAPPGRDSAAAPGAEEPAPPAADEPALPEGEEPAPPEGEEPAPPEGEETRPTQPKTAAPAGRSGGSDWGPAQRS